MPVGVGGYDKVMNWGKKFEGVDLCDPLEKGAGPGREAAMGGLLQSWG